MKIVEFIALNLALMFLCTGASAVQAQEFSQTSSQVSGRSFPALIGSVIPEKQQIAYCNYQEDGVAGESATVINLGDTTSGAAAIQQTQTNNSPIVTPAAPTTALPPNGLNGVLGSPSVAPVAQGAVAQPAPVASPVGGGANPAAQSGQPYAPVVAPIVSGASCDGRIVGCDSGSCGPSYFGSPSRAPIQYGIGDCGSGSCATGACGSANCGCDGNGSYFPGSSLFKGTLLGLFRDSLRIDQGRRTLSLFGGLNWLVDSPNSSLFNNTSNLDDEYLVGGSIGRRISQRVRTDFEYTYRRNEGPLNGSAQVIDTEVSSFLINGYLYSRRCFRSIRPYVGAGLGMAYVDFQEGLPGQTPARFATSNTNFAWQGIGGLETQFGRAALFAEYRFFTTGQIEFNDTNLNTTGEGNYFAHNVIFGLRLNF